MRRVNIRGKMSNTGEIIRIFDLLIDSDGVQVIEVKDGKGRKVVSVRDMLEQIRRAQNE